MDDIGKAHLARIDPELVRHLVDGTLDRELALRGAVATEGAARRRVGVDDVIGEATCADVVVDRERLVTDEADGRGRMITVGAGVRQRIEVDGRDRAVVHGAKTDAHAHLVASVAARHGLLARVDALAWVAELIGAERGVDLVAAGLLGAESTADAGLDDADAALGNLESDGDLTTDVERHLRGGDHAHAILGVRVGVGAEGLHHRLLGRLGLVDAVDDDVRLLERALEITVLGDLVADEVALEVLAHGHIGADVILVMNDRGVVERLLEVENGGENLVVDLDEAHGGVDGELIRANHDGNLVADVAHGAVEDHRVVRAHLTEALAGKRVAHLGNVLVGVDGDDAVDSTGTRGVNGADVSVRIGRTQQLDNVGVARGKVVRVDGTTLEQALRIFLDNGVRKLAKLAGAGVRDDALTDGSH